MADPTKNGYSVSLPTDNGTFQLRWSFQDNVFADDQENGFEIVKPQRHGHYTQYIPLDATEQAEASQYILDNFDKIVPEATKIMAERIQKTDSDLGGNDVVEYADILNVLNGIGDPSPGSSIRDINTAQDLIALISLGNAVASLNTDTSRDHSISQQDKTTALDYLENRLNSQSALAVATTIPALAPQAPAVTTQTNITPLSIEITADDAGILKATVTGEESYPDEIEAYFAANSATLTPKIKEIVENAMKAQGTDDEINRTEAKAIVDALDEKLLEAQTAGTDPATIELYRRASFEAGMIHAAAPDKPEIKITPNNDTALLQSLLTLNGHDAGDVDGIPGRKTSAGVEAYAEEQNLTDPTNASVLAHLKERLASDPAFKTQIQSAVLADGQDVRTVQRALNHFVFKDGDDSLTINGIKGANTNTALGDLKTIMNAESELQTKFEAEEQARAIAAQEAAAEVAAAEALAAKNDAILTDNDRVINSKVLGAAEEALARWKAENPGQDLPEQGLISSTAKGGATKLFSESDPILIREVNGEMVVHQIHNGNAANILQSGFVFDPKILEKTANRALDREERSSAGRFPDEIKFQGITFGLDKDGCGCATKIKFTSADFEKRDNRHVTSLVSDSEGNRQLVEAKDLRRAFSQHDSTRELSKVFCGACECDMGKWADDVNDVEKALKDAIKNGTSTNLNVVFAKSGERSMAVISMDGKGELAKIPETLYNKIINASQDGKFEYSQQLDKIEAPDAANNAELETPKAG